jgi:hypothetical protein
MTSGVPRQIVTATFSHLLLAGVLFSGIGCDARATEPDEWTLEPSVPAETESGRIDPWPENPRYWQYQGEPILLLGGSDQDNLFNHPDLPPYGLAWHLELLRSVEGNYVRNTMSSRDEGNVWPFRALGDGTYDLDGWNEEYWQRFESFLEMTEAGGIIVQLEIWDRFDFAREPWEQNPFNPIRNINFTPEQIGLPTRVRSHPGDRENPFFRSTPGQEDNPRLLGYQRAFVDKLLSISLPFPHVLYTVSNETNESPVWSAYWADFIRERAEAKGVSVHVTEMWDAWDLNHPSHGYTVDDPHRYTFIEASQGSHRRGEDHWRNIQELHQRIDHKPRPINSVKIYGGPVHGGSYEEGTRKFWRNIFGGLASSRFHRPEGAGIGLNPLARPHLRSMRMLVEEMPVFEAKPRNDLLSDRGADEAYAMVEEGVRYAVYFPEPGSVSLDLSGATRPMVLRWLEILEARWSESLPVSGTEVLLEPPGDGAWVALLTAESHSSTTPTQQP